MTFKNLDGTTPDKGPRDLFKWMIADRVRGLRPRVAPFETPRRVNDGAELRTASPSLTWIGHATFAMRLGGMLIATDPVWSTRVGPIKRNVSPGVALDAMPKLDIVTVSHAHYDHMDVPTLARIGKDALYVVPKDNGDVLRRAGLTSVVELAWWESHTVGDLRITCVPAQHWSMRFPWDRNKRLWGGFVYESSEGIAYHAGDTAFSEEVFRAIGNVFSRARSRGIDWAMMPIGAYEPTWFMASQHIGPEDAGRAFELLDARALVAMHWGTFQLTDEPMGEPPERIRSWWSARGFDPERLWVLDIGETRELTRLAGRLERE